MEFMLEITIILFILTLLLVIGKYKGGLFRKHTYIKKENNPNEGYSDYNPADYYPWYR